jgi:hypothetical protein
MDIAAGSVRCGYVIADANPVCGSRARVLGYQSVPLLCFNGPERIILTFKLRPLTAERGHCTAIRKHIHSTFPQSE